ncbi:hypothetical protein M5E06_32640 [Azospirillum sp. A1-3]|uniref:hypothetical protein n=1 Tax=Azospirillum sp. A1-3 TaxID=185874 RepID=UPI002076F997|nr:hypothetical protein [Azospirillum sp. A1-3]MCM8738839.1 hypothetical protein [Azospirillum sp. A1-3]
MDNDNWSEEILLSEDEVAEALIASANQLRLGDLVGCAVGGQTGFDVAFLTASQLLHAFEVKGGHPSWGCCQQSFDSGFARLPQIASGLRSLRTLDNRVEHNVKPDLVSLAVPDTEHFRRHSGAFVYAFDVLGYGLYLVGPGAVECILPPRQIVPD